MKHKTLFIKRILMLFIAVGVLGYLVMWLWNAILPSLFSGVSEISYLKAIGLMVLCRILFGGFHGQGGWHHQRHMQRWAQMTDEEKQRFQRRFGCRDWHKQPSQD